MNNFINQVCKIQLSREGYLSEYPYHLISNSELADAFFETQVTIVDNNIQVDASFENSRDFFHQNFICDTSWSPEVKYGYQKLHRAIQLIVGNWKYLQSASISHMTLDTDDVQCELTVDALPDWVYSYILHKVICQRSSDADIHTLLDLLDIDNPLDEFSAEVAEKCYKVSAEWLAKFPQIYHRPPSVFGEPHVIKSLRIAKQGD